MIPDLIYGLKLVGEADTGSFYRGQTLGNKTKEWKYYTLYENTI